MRHLIIAILLFSSCCQSFGQRLITDDSTFLKPGIYTSFQEFRENNPSVLDSFSIQVDPVKAHGVAHTAYHLVLTTDLNEKDIWGFCDGQYVYKKGWKGLIKEDVYDKFLYVGRYCILYVFVPAHLAPAAGSYNGMLYPSVRVKTNTITPILMNFNNGDIFLPNKYAMKMILEDDSELYAKYKALKKYQRKNAWADFIKAFCEKHKDEIKSKTE